MSEMKVLEDWYTTGQYLIKELNEVKAELDALRALAEAAEKLEKHWKDEYAHFACGGEANLLEALAEWRKLTAKGGEDE